MKATNICIPVFYTEGTSPTLLKEICSGLEEEGVRLLTRQKEHQALYQMGHSAASFSALQVGIAVDDTGIMIIHHSKLPIQKPYIQQDKNGRSIGKNAARLVKGLSLITDNEEEM